MGETVQSDETTLTTFLPVEERSARSEESSAPVEHLDLFVSAGDASGDAHGSEVVEWLRRLVRHLRVRGIGGPHLEASGVSLIYDSSRWSVIGPIEAVKLIPSLLVRFWKVIHLLREEPPDALLLIDFGAFNVRLARAAKRLGIPVLYYFPPRSWAREGQIGLGIAGVADRIATPFSWSAERLRKAGARVEWVGHPVLERAASSKSAEELRAEFGCSPEDLLVAIFPGSRVPEIKQILPLILRACPAIQAENPTVKFLLSRAVNLDESLIQRVMRKSRRTIPLVAGRVYDLMAAADFGIAVSGTVTLEAACMGMPMVIVYTGPWFARFLWKRFMNLPMVGMPNILLGKMVAPELIADALTVKSLTQTVIQFLNDRESRRKMADELRKVRHLLGPGGAAQRTATMVIEMVKEQRHLPESAMCGA